jgi:hypothetical protein
MMHAQLVRYPCYLSRFVEEDHLFHRFKTFLYHNGTGYSHSHTHLRCVASVGAKGVHHNEYLCRYEKNTILIFEPDELASLVTLNGLIGRADLRRYAVGLITVTGPWAWCTA